MVKLPEAALARAGALAVTSLLAGCALLGRPRNADRPWPWKEDRSEYLERGRVWLGTDLDSWVRDMRRLDLASGPAAPDAFRAEQLLRCDYVQPRAGSAAGRTPKFLCRERDGSEPLKIKWGGDNGEVYAEVAATRLLWALGFPADRMYPVRVECHGCPEDPWQGGEVDPQSTRMFEPAAVERPFPGMTIEGHDDQGWTWTELARVEAEAGPTARAQIDALKLLAAFLQHRDSKASNQRLVCRAEAVVQKRSGGRRSCREPILLIDDLGSTFGGRAKIFTHKMAVDVWEQEPVWDDPRRCIANLTAEFVSPGGLERPAISDEGRRFLSTLLDALDDRQVRALFRVARAERRGGLARWVAAFDRHRDAVRRPVPSEPAFRCPG